ELSRRERVSLFIVLLAAFKTLLHRYTGQEDILVGSPVASRTRAQLKGLTGCFANILVLHTNLSGNPTFRELVGRVKEAISGASAHQDLPFETLIEELKLSRDLSCNSLFQVMFALETASHQPLGLSSLTLNPLEMGGQNIPIELGVLV